MTVVSGVIERSLIIRSCILWLLIRLLICMAFLMFRASAPSAAAAAGDPLFLSPAAAVIVIAVTATLSWLVTRLWFENLMLANLGTPPWIAASLVSIPPLVLELVVAQAGPV
jgi:hypothetical protein